MAKWTAKANTNANHDNRTILSHPSKKEWREGPVVMESIQQSVEIARTGSVQIQTRHDIVTTKVRAP